MKTAVMNWGPSFPFRVEGLDELGHHLTAVRAFEERLFDGQKNGIHLRTHSFADVSHLGLPVAVMENADESLRRASLEMLFLAELDELRARSLGRVADGATAM